MKNVTSKGFEVFESEYRKEEKEITILTSDSSGGATKCYDSWVCSKYFLVYFDVSSNEIKKGDGRINWLISDEDNRKHGFTWPYNFRNGTIYRLKVRDLIDKTVPEGRLPSYYNRFMVVEVIEENVHNDELLSILAEYRTPSIITDDALGKFVLDKDLGLFEGEITWLDKIILAYLEVATDNKDSWTQAMSMLHALTEQQKQKDIEFRAFAAKELTNLANDWSQDEDAVEISKEDFIDRISLTSLSVTSSGDFTAYYNDDDMFLGHAVAVYGNSLTGIKSANIEG